MQKTGTRLFNVVYIGQLEEEWGFGGGYGWGEGRAKSFP